MCLALGIVGIVWDGIRESHNGKSNEDDGVAMVTNIFEALRLIIWTAMSFSFLEIFVEQKSNAPGCRLIPGLLKSAIETPLVGRH